MNRVINVCVNGELISKDSKNAGVQGEGNATSLHIEMSADWEKYSKRIIWVNALGENPVAIILYNSVNDLISGGNPLVFDTKIPAEAMDEVGWCCFSIEGYSEDEPNAVAMTVSEYLFVKPNDSCYVPKEPTPTQAQQLHAMINGITKEVVQALESALTEIDNVEEEMSVWEPWDSEKTYRPLNKVEQFGSSYICIMENTGMSPAEDVDDNFWVLIASKGDRGERGLQGQTGPQGPRGINGVAVATSGMVAFNVDEDGDLWCSYTGDEQPNYYIGDDGNLYLEI